MRKYKMKALRYIKMFVKQLKWINVANKKPQLNCYSKC